MGGGPRGGPQTHSPGDWLAFRHWYSEPDVEIDIGPRQ